MLRFLGFVFTFALGVGGLVTVDFMTAKRWSDAQEGDELTLSAYFSDIPARLATFSAASRTGLPRGLKNMMPSAPEGWTVRPTVPEDTDPFATSDAPLEARRYVQAVGAAPTGSDVEAVMMTYERGERRVVVQALRYSDAIFTDLTELATRGALHAIEPAYRGRPSMTIRGLDITEDVLPEGMNARYFMGDVGGQIHIRAVTSKKLREEDLVDILGTLHVQAMNASVVNRTPGLGEVLAIVLVSALDDATREAYDIERAARRDAEAARREKDRLAAEAELQKTDVALADSDAVKPGNIARGECNERAGTKFCGVSN